MRVHRLEITAFGPFAGTEVIDFDALSDAGIFLLTGQTGAGKTTILDAICFGLFGAVPGARNGANDLKSHHAGPHDAPAVVLEVTMRDRRFRIRRSPSWTRPSRRAASGYVDQHAKATIEELVDGDWVARAARVDDVGLLVTRVLGMSRAQFCQVVMLPQGMFQTFLRAGARERHDVLESLFETSRFSRIEAWLGDHRRSCERDVEAQRAVICQLLARADEVGGAIRDGEAALIERGEFDDARSALAELVEATAARAVVAVQCEAAAGMQLKVVRHALDSARDLEARQRSHRAGVERLRELDALRDVVVQRTRQVARAESARSFIPLLDLLAEADDHRAAADERVTLAGGGDTVSPAQVDERVTALRDRRARLESLAAVEKQLDDLTARIAEAQSELALLDTSRQQQRRLADELPALLADAMVQLAMQSETAGGLVVAQAELAAAESGHVAAERAAGIAGELDRLAAAVRVALDERHEARTHWLDLREQRLQGMAAELAGQLTAGSPCLVCGSPEHPAPATSHGGQVSAAAEAAALAVLQRCEATEAGLAMQVAEARTTLAAVTVQSGGFGPEKATARLRQARDAVEAAHAAVAARDRLGAEIAALDRHSRDIEADVHRLDTAYAVQRQTLTGLTAQRDERRRELSSIVRPGERVAQLSAATIADLSAAVELREAVRERDRREWTLTEARTRLADALEPTGFVDIDDLRRSILTDADIAAADALNRAFDADQRAATGIVDDPVLVAAAALPAPDLAAMEASLADADAAHAAARTRADRLAERRARLEELLQLLDSALIRWGPLVVSRDVAASVAAMCAGTAADNVTKTRLSHYVLAARLAQVVAAGNLRLAGIVGGRYQLQHSMARGVGDKRGGLGLLVLDTYTGQRRDPATLSGGETFYVSLALALGLADLVRDEIGGTELSTLFVDEGFGTLDTQTLDEVMDEIDSLRSGGRSVGLVSHLSELRTRIPVQLHVSAGRAGSTISSR